MATGRGIRQRIKATRNIRQITRAMEAVSAVKMRRSQSVALAARPFALAALRLLRNIRAATPENNDVSLPLLMNRRSAGRPYIVVLTSDKGLAGSFNANVLRRASEVLASRDGGAVVAVGKKGADFFRRRGVSRAREFTGFGDIVELSEVMPLAEFLRSEFEAGRCREAVIVYANFISTMRQEVVVRTILPMETETLTTIARGITPVSGRFSELHAEDREEMLHADYTFEPSPEAALSAILPELFLAAVYHAILEANASEHSSRMLAMRNASENAGELIRDLVIEYNKGRQALITKELLEITAGKEALEM